MKHIKALFRKTVEVNLNCLTWNCDTVNSLLSILFSLLFSSECVH